MAEIVKKTNNFEKGMKVIDLQNIRLNPAIKKAYTLCKKNEYSVTVLNFMVVSEMRRIEKAKSLLETVGAAGRSLRINLDKFQPVLIDGNLNYAVKSDPQYLFTESGIINILEIPSFRKTLMPELYATSKKTTTKKVVKKVAKKKAVKKSRRSKK